jgi:hypothetical protein
VNMSGRWSIQPEAGHRPSASAALPAGPQGHEL